MKLKKLVTTTIDSQATVYSLAKAEIDHIISKHPNLKKSMEDKTFDNELMQKHGCKTLSELTIAVHKTRSKYEDEKKGGYEEQFSKAITEIVAHIKGKLDQDEIKILSESIIAKLEKFGGILTL